MSKKRLVLEGLGGDFSVNGSDMLLFGKRMSVPGDSELRRCILEEGHSSAYAMRQGGNKLYRNLRENFWWRGMKKDVVEFVSKCLTCQQAKMEHQRPAGLMQILPIPEWKGKHVTMNFVVGFPRCT